MDPQVFCHGHPTRDDLVEIFFCNINATILTFYVNSSHLIYIYYLCTHFVYVAQHFVCGPHVLALLTPLGNPGVVCYSVLCSMSFYIEYGIVWYCIVQCVILYYVMCFLYCVACYSVLCNMLFGIV